MSWRWFWAWCLAGVLTLVGFAFLPSIGIFILPFAVVAVVLLSWRAPVWPESLGFISGFGLAIASFGLAVAMVDSGEGPDARPLLAAGLGVAVAGAVVGRVLGRVLGSADGR